MVGRPVKFINGYVPIYGKEDSYDERLSAGARSEAKKKELIDQIHEGDPKTFGHIANKALLPRSNEDGFMGIEALGVLKADVDNLGLLMSCGLTRERFTLSRLATLSRQMHWYFALFLPHLLQTDRRFRDVYTVFAGGDDLFLIGPWNRVIDLAGVLNETFSSYVCRNEQIHLSAGISLQKPHTPLDRIADTAESALKKSKESGKNRITLFSETAEWEQFLRLQEVKGELREWIEEDLMTGAMLYRLNEFTEMAEMEKFLLKGPKVTLEQMHCLKWHALFHYTTQRNVGKNLKGKERDEAIRKFQNVAEWLKKYGAMFRIALWDVIYNQRGIKNG